GPRRCPHRPGRGPRRARQGHEGPTPRRAPARPRGLRRWRSGPDAAGWSWSVHSFLTRWRSFHQAIPVDVEPASRPAPDQPLVVTDHQEGGPQLLVQPFHHADQGGQVAVVLAGRRLIENEERLLRTRTRR